MSDENGRGHLVYSKKGAAYTFHCGLKGDTFPFILTPTRFLIDKYIYRADVTFLL